MNVTKTMISISFFVLIQVSCSKQSYTCDCINANGDVVKETGWHKGNNPDTYLIQVENSLVLQNNYTSCSCFYD